MAIGSNLVGKDLTGMRFGKWFVEGRAPKDISQKGRDVYWNCVCDCGTRRKVLGKYLRSGKSTSCGCKNKKDYTGRRFGSLVVLETLYEYQGNKRATYKCRCDCGNIVYMTGDIFNRKSCGHCRHKNARKDYTGQKFGKLTVLEMLYNYDGHQTFCKCKCDCGNTGYITRMNGLITGNTTSCGCVHSPDITGMRFNRLVVIRRADLNEIDSINKNRDTQKWWLCKCDCGNYHYATTNALTSGHVKSCGCLFSENVSTYELLISNILKKSHLRFMTEKTFPDLYGINGYHLRFDFYLPDLNMCIEYDGRQHFQSIEYFGGEEAFLTLTANDEIKNKYCQNNYIHLLRIPYTTPDSEIPNIIKNFVNMIQESRNDHSNISNYITYAGNCYNN